MDYVRLLYELPYGLVMELLEPDLVVYIRLHCLIDNQIYQPFILMPYLDDEVYKKIWLESSPKDKFLFAAGAFCGVTLSFDGDSKLADINLNLLHYTPYDGIIARTFLHKKSIATVIGVSICYPNNGTTGEYVQLVGGFNPHIFAGMLSNHSHYESIYDLITASMEIVRVRLGGDYNKH